MPFSIHHCWYSSHVEPRCHSTLQFIQYRFLHIGHSKSFAKKKQQVWISCWKNIDVLANHLEPWSKHRNSFWGKSCIFFKKKMLKKKQPTLLNSQSYGVIQFFMQGSRSTQFTSEYDWYKSQYFLSTIFSKSFNEISILQCGHYKSDEQFFLLLL